ncbi:NRPS-like enzyme [Penicillium pulvis]|uniref:NRPS-like enzyme n=1 Tax=Penicillium pulvis TaxID=1562058 RepID=UPI0025493B71|nr:NRPS-like enzyme [Penicillium pulvis]KAJ5809237.1 NRPS-like enzyme [Penicillium pulvis]
MRKLPDSLGPFKVDWLRIDAAAQIMTEIVRDCRYRTDPGLTVYNITTSAATEWQSLTGLVAKPCDASVVALDEWVQDMELLVKGENADLREPPAAGLLDIFWMLVNWQNDTMPALDVTNAQVASPTLQQIGPVGEEIMEIWQIIYIYCLMN